MPRSADLETLRPLLKEVYDVAGISEQQAESAHRQGSGLAKHLGVKRGTDRWNRIVYGTKRAKGWRPSREKGHSSAARNALQKNMHRKRY